MLAFHEALTRCCLDISSYIWWSELDRLGLGRNTGIWNCGLYGWSSFLLKLARHWILCLKIFSSDWWEASNGGTDCWVHKCMDNPLVMVIIPLWPTCGFDLLSSTGLNKKRKFCRAWRSFSVFSAQTQLGYLAEEYYPTWSLFGIITGCPE